ncbi:MAG: ABC transporter ATP-binding protein [candidate division KSB1 bacterium]|nr:ABC transporter ATP-binding protein [candidate division KSB1 bacterium]MDZ7274702.1 ABC transporter ATP-binding protein [candidate division KSB1 bacterium]MDZ7285527.1 ABC transporter ATP-binding protein [candidate division KSB1 bacterium]MDZ7298559.1 ABC transporter ATP-binding protein [candidate division KSB1 bacterium]MDZ7306589.1 ABC transporter ATP-binding protein [candidate division KSB1 bacterium]
MSPVIHTHNLTKNFGTLTALAQVNLTVAPGTVFGFLGPNGAGKTTTVRLLNGLLLPTAGQAFVLGHEVPRDSQLVRQRCGVQTDTNLYEKLTVQENLEIWGGLYGLRGSALRQRLGSLLEQFDLAEKRRDLAGSLSKGMKQKLSIARALIHDPEILFLDEPTAGLDPETSEELLHYLRRFITGRPRTVFLCSHRLEEVELLCEAVAIIDHGSLLASGTIAELRRQLWPERVWWIDFLEPREQFFAALRQAGWQPQPAAPAHHLRIALRHPAEIAAVVRTLVQAGADIVAVQEERRSLKDIYFALVPGQNHESVSH